MKTLAHRALSIGAAAALLVGCGGSQPPIAATPQAIRLAPERVLVPRVGTGSSSYQVLYTFGPNAGREGIEAIINVQGTFYGTTSGGGPSNGGTVYSLTAAGKRKFLHSFAGGVSDGLGPVGHLTSVHGAMYGATRGGGKCLQGTVYSITTAGTVTLLHSFCGSADGLTPEAGLTYADGLLYGTTSRGGIAGGVIYSISTTGAFKVLYRFRNSRRDGSSPSSSLLDVNGVLYGTTPYGGGAPACVDDSGCGTVYSVTRSGKEKVLYRFKGGSDGWFPISGLISGGGTLYGTTPFGGTYDEGTVFSVSMTGTEHVLHVFSGGSDGAGPLASLLEMNGVLYGTTNGGGSSDDGTIFSVTKNGTEQVLHSFSGEPDGANPGSRLTNLNATLFGTTNRGGNVLCRRGCATVFRLTP